MLTSWQVPEQREEGTSDSGLLVSLHFLMAALRRRWRTWTGIALVAVVLGVAWVALVPPRSTGTVTLMLAHDPGVEPSLAMATDISLLRTRTVATTLTDRLDIDLPPEDLQASVTATPDTSQVLRIELVASGDAEARDRVEALAEVFLEFRQAQLRAGSDAVIAGNRARVERLEKQVAVLTDEYERISAEGEGSSTEAAGVLNERSRLTSEILELQQSSEEAALEVDAVLSASGVIDPAAVVPSSALRRWVLTVGSALVGGLGLGVGWVLVTALASNRLRRRDEVAMALGAPVKASVIGRTTRTRLLGPAHTVVSGAFAPGHRPARCAIAAVDAPGDAERLAVAVAAELVRSGASLFVVDLSDRGHLESAVGRLAKEQGLVQAPAVFRPASQPVPSRGPLRVAGPRPSVLPDSDPRRPALEAADAVLTLVEIAPTTDLDELAPWVDEVVLVVGAGRNSAERLRTIAELVRAAGLELSMAVLTGADRHDESLGQVAQRDESIGSSSTGSHRKEAR